MVTALKAHSDARLLLMGGQKEKTFIQERERGLLPLKARLDIRFRPRSTATAIRYRRPFTPTSAKRCPSTSFLCRPKSLMKSRFLKCPAWTYRKDGNKSSQPSDALMSAG